MISISSFICYQPQVKKVSFLEIDYFDPWRLGLFFVKDNSIDNSNQSYFL